MPKVAVAEVDVVPGDVVRREAVALRVAEREADRRLLAQRTGRVRAHVDGAEVAERDDGGTGPLRQGRPRAADVNQPAERVPPEQRALRPADELHLADVEELDAGGVRVELRHAVDVGRDRGVRRARADAPEARRCSASAR